MATKIDQQSNYILILTSSVLELEAVLKHLKSTKTTKLHAAGKDLPYSARIGTFENYSVVAICSYNAGNHQIQIAMTAAVNQFSPALVIFVGIGGGVGEDVRIGDVVISDHIADLSYLVENANNTSVNMKGGPIDASLVSLANQVKADGNWVKRIFEPSVERHDEIKREIIVGTVGAGNTLVKTTGGLTASFIATAGPEIRVIEMESASCYATAHTYGTSYIAVRGISDKLSDKDKKTDAYRQPWAAAHAAAAAFELVHLVVEDSRSNEGPGELKVAIDGIKVDQSAASEDLQEKKNVGPSWAELSTIHNFGKLPVMHRGRILHLHVHFDGVSHSSSKEDCEALGLTFGASLVQKITIMRPQIGDIHKLYSFDFLSKIYAEFEQADWLMNVKSSKMFLASEN